MTNATLSANVQSAPFNSLKLLLDILIIVIATIAAFVIEEFMITNGWIDLAPNARGVSSVLAGAFAAVAITFARGGSFADLGFKPPARWSIVPVQVITILTIFIAAQHLLPWLLSPFIDVPTPDLSRHETITGDLGAAILLALVMPLTASIPEEIIYRGFLIGRLTQVFDGNSRGNAMSVLISALFFCSVHFAWGLGGIIVTFMMGLIWGTAYLLCDKNLWVVILAHSAAHVLFAIQLYLGVTIVI